MRHVAPVIGAIRHIRRIRIVVNKAIDSRRIKNTGQAVDDRRIGWIPTQVDGWRGHSVMAECGCGNEGAESRGPTY